MPKTANHASHFFFGILTKAAGTATARTKISVQMKRDLKGFGRVNAYAIAVQELITLRPLATIIHSSDHM